MSCFKMNQRKVRSQNTINKNIKAVKKSNNIAIKENNSLVVESQKILAQIANTSLATKKTTDASIFVTKKIFQKNSLNETLVIAFSALNEHMIEVEGANKWRARDIKNFLGYDRWFNFNRIVRKAILYFEKSGLSALNYIKPYSRKMSFVNNFTRTSPDYYLTKEALKAIGLLADQDRCGVLFLEMYASQVEVDDIVSNNSNADDNYLIQKFKDHFNKEKAKMNQTAKLASANEKKLIEELYVADNNSISKVDTTVKIKQVVTAFFKSDEFKSLNHSQKTQLEKVVSSLMKETEKLYSKTKKLKAGKKQNFNKLLKAAFKGKTNIFDISGLTSKLKL